MTQYMKSVSHLSLQRVALNEVDMVVLNNLTYLIDPFTLEDITLPVSISTFYEHCKQAYQRFTDWNPFLFTAERVDWLSLMAQSIRYRDIQISHISSKIDPIEVTQFMAVTYDCGSQQYLIIFKGTDDTLVGWREDFNMASQTYVPAQQSALNYLITMTQQLKAQSMILSGHSKGGNLAIYAAGMAPDAIQTHIQAVYAFDCPGFQREVRDQIAAQDIIERLHLYCPEEAIIGRILYEVKAPQVILCSKKGFFQHDIANWQVNQLSFATTTTFSPLSQHLKAVMDNWLEQHDRIQREQFFTLFFDLLESADIQSLNDLNNNSLKFIGLYLQIFNELDIESKDLFMTNIQELITHFLQLNLESRNQQYHTFLAHVQAKLQELEAVRNKL